jgi:GTP-binding protein
LPDTPAEVAFIGRSNVGKSSLVNALGNRKDLARVAKAPGRTQLLNCFEVEGLGTLVDCPGYGYASAPARVREGWQRMVETYLLEREQLTMVVMLVDGEIGPTKLDLEMLAWLRANGVPHSVVATKHDKVKAAHRDKRKREVATACNLAPATSPGSAQRRARARTGCSAWPAPGFRSVERALRPRRSPQVACTCTDSHSAHTRRAAHVGLHESTTAPGAAATSGLAAPIPQPYPSQYPQQYPQHGVYQPQAGAYPPGVVHYGTPTRTSGLAIASMVLGILWLYWIGSILAVIFGHIAISQAGKDPAIKGKGMAIAGLVLATSASAP